MPDDKPIDRRRFFRAGFAELFKPLGKIARPLEQLAQGLSKLEQPTAPNANSGAKTGVTDSGSDSAPAPRRGAAAGFPRAPIPLQVNDRPFLRPPGALDEPRFRDTCSKCGNCVAACPVQCIQLDKSGREGAGVPFIDTAIAACTLCEELACMAACPTGALVPTPRDRIDMGTAFWNQQLCVRTNGEECTRCIDFCPVGESAIALDQNRIQVKQGCTGCGLCQHQCPTDPKSIIVIPKSVRK
jgi:ferredoxin-type protein NapG